MQDVQLIRERPSRPSSGHAKINKAFDDHKYPAIIVKKALTLGG
jgi:hypothetical protein